MTDSDEELLADIEKDGCDGAKCATHSHRVAALVRRLQEENAGLTQKIILFEGLNRQCESRIAFLENENRNLFSNDESAEKQLKILKEECPSGARGFIWRNKAMEAERKLEMARAALEASKVLWRGGRIGTCDMGRCNKCWAMTSSGSNHWCEKCAKELCKEALAQIGEGK